MPRPARRSGFTLACRRAGNGRAAGPGEPGDRLPETRGGYARCVMWSERVDTVLVDVDGTLVDSNYQHALAWFRAFRQHDITLPVWTIHRAIGMGGDQLVAYLTDDEVERQYGDTLSSAWQDEFAPMLAELTPLPKAHALLA